MTREVHPCPVAKNDSSSTTSTMAPAKSIMVHESRLHPGAPLINRGAPLIAPPTLPMSAAMPAVPISVTTASYPDPELSSSQRHNIQLTTGGALPQQKFYPTAAKLAGPEGGFTLPCGEPDSVVPPPVPTTPIAPKTVPIKKSASASPLTRGYSAASIASIHAQGGKTHRTSSLGRRTHSAPNTVVLTNNKSKFKYQKVAGGKVSAGSMVTLEPELSPQQFLDKMLTTRGYSTSNFCSLDGGYYCKPTALQKASYGLKIIQAVRTSDAELLQTILDCGLSPNPCNQFGESIVHMVCRRGDMELLKILVNAGCVLQVTDDFGRTPLHDACWTAEPSFDCVELILNHDARLLHIVDCRGSSPLSYVKQEHWKEWIEFFKRKADTYWPARDVSKEGEQTPPALAGASAHSGPISDPKNAIPVELATLIASGKLDPNEFLRRKKEAMDAKRHSCGQTMMEAKVPACS